MKYLAMIEVDPSKLSENIETELRSPCCFCDYSNLKEVEIPCNICKYLEAVPGDVDRFTPSPLLSETIEAELGWAHESGISVIKVERVL